MRSLGSAVLALVLLVGASPLAGQAQPAPAPAAEPAPATATPSVPPAPPSAGPIPAPTLTPTPAPTATATATPTGSPYKFVVDPPAPPRGQPAIMEIAMLDSTIHEGAPYSVRVKTSLDVTNINVSTMGQTYGMQGAGPGLFATDGQVPGGIPFFMLNRSYTITVTAQTADHRSTAVTLNLRLEK
jgi:hypothetical protein